MTSGITHSRKLAGLAVAVGLSLLAAWSPATANTLVVVKLNTAIAWTTYQADGLGLGQTPYSRKAVTGMDAESQYEVLDLTTGDYASVAFYTVYNRGVAIKRYSFFLQLAGGGQKFFGPCAPALYSRLVSPNKTPKYQYVKQFRRGDAFGGPDDPLEPSTFQYKLAGMFYATASVGLTTVIPGKGAVLPVLALAPVGATGNDNRYEVATSYITSVNDPSLILPDPVSRAITFSTGKVTQAFDSALTTKANATTVPAASLVDYDGTVLTPNTLKYAVKVIRDSLEATGYELDGF